VEFIEYLRRQEANETMGIIDPEDYERAALRKTDGFI
jgi:hypothetical protein